MSSKATLADSHQLTVAFVVALAVGIGLIFVHPIAPCVPLLLYAVLGFLLTKKQRNSDRFADSLYYLGFLLTLSALLIALMDFSDKADAFTVARSLGAGLSASILGLGLRVLTVQFRGTVADQEEEAQISIEQQADKLRQALMEFENQWRSAAATVNTVQLDLENFKSSLETLHSDTLETARKRQKSLLESTAKAIDVWEKEINGVRDKLASIDIPENLARDVFERFATQVAVGVGEVVSAGARAMEKATTSLGRLANEGDAYAGRMRMLTSAMHEAAAATQATKDAVTVLTAEIERAGHGTKSTVLSIDEPAKRLAAALESVNVVLNRTGTGLNALETSAAKAADKVLGIASDVEANSDALVNDIKSTKNDLAGVRAATEELVDLARTEFTKAS